MILDTGDEREKGDTEEFVTKTGSPGGQRYNW